MFVGARHAGDPASPAWRAPTVQGSQVATATVDADAQGGNTQAHECTAEQ